MRRCILPLALAAAACLAFTGGAVAGKHATPIAASGSCVTHTAGGYPAVSCVNHTWRCDAPQAHTQVDVLETTGGASGDAIHLDAGCTGTIRVAVDTDAADGIKVHDGAHDLTIWGYVSCDGKHAGAHQDGVQATSGARVTLKWVKVDCPSGNNGGLYIQTGKHGTTDAPPPTDIVCEHCTLFEGNAALLVGANSVRSGARWSTLYRGTSKSAPASCSRIDKTADAPVNVDNVCEARP